MPSPRSSPSIRPSSPLSPRFESAAQFGSLAPLSPRAVHSRTGNSQRRANTNSLKLPSLPRFHPANFPSSHSSLQSTPEGIASPAGPVSPRAQQRYYSDAQRHLYMYQRDTLAAAARTRSPGRSDKPVSPRLAPLGSPGPVTPLELEGQEGYMVAGVRSASKDTSTAEELVERLIAEERVRRHASRSPQRSASRGQ